MTQIEAQRSKQPGAQEKWERGREKRRVFLRQLPQPPPLLRQAPRQQPDRFGFTSCSPWRRAIIVAIPESNQGERKRRGSGPHPVGRISCWIIERRGPHEQSPEGSPLPLVSAFSQNRCIFHVAFQGAQRAF